MGIKKVARGAKKVLIRVSLFVVAGLCNTVGASTLNLQDVSILTASHNSAPQEESSSQGNSSSQEEREAWMKQGVTYIWQTAQYIFEKGAELLEKENTVKQTNTVVTITDTSSTISATGQLPYEMFFPSLSGSKYFSDINGHTYQNAIETLAAQGIVDSSRDKFYPDNYVRRYDFVIMLVNSLRTQQKLSQQHSTRTTGIVDVPANASYTTSVYDAYEAGIINYLLVTKRGENLLMPDNFLTKHEALHILDQVFDGEIIYDVDQADQAKITRGELAQLLISTIANPQL